MALTVVVRSSDGAAPELSLTLDSPRIVIGRSDGCDVRLPDPSVSHRHASLRQRGGEYVVVDEGSTNGTFLGQVRLPPQTPRAVKHGELVRVGRVWLEIRFEAALAKSGAAAAAKEIALELVARGLAAQGEAAGPRITVAAGPDIGKTLSLSEAARRYSIGRAKDADLALEDADASRRHVEVARKGDALVVQDLGSKTGTFLDDVELPAAETTWRVGQQLTFGQNRFAFEYPAAEALAELERSPDERMRGGEAPEPPRGAEDSAATPAPPPGSLEVTDTPPPVSAALESASKAARAEGSWSLTDGAVVLLALGVLALSVAGAWLMLGR